MRVTTIDNFEPAPGTFVQWSVTAGAATLSNVPPSFNQTFHLAATDEHSVWLAATFDVDGPIDRIALGNAYAAFVARHHTLRSCFIRRGDAVERYLYDFDELDFHEQSGPTFESSAAMQQFVRETTNAQCRPLGYPSFVLAAIDRADRSTVYCAFDHAHVDAYSIAMVVAELDHLYTEMRTSTAHHDPDPLPRVGSFVDYCALEASTASTHSTDPLLHDWVRFLEDNDNAPPSFPIDLGLAPGTTAPQAVDLRDVLNADEAHRFETVCTSSNASIFAGLLAAVAKSVRAMTGRPDTAVLIPMHTRREQQWRNAVGWFVTNAPLTIPTGPDFADTVHVTGQRLHHALTLGAVPIARVIEELGGLNRPRNDVFMISYIDYRRLPGTTLRAARDPQHISNVTVADDAQFWISRTEHGISLRSRYPATAETVMPAFFRELSKTIRESLTTSFE